MYKHPHASLTFLNQIRNTALQQFNTLPLSAKYSMIIYGRGQHTFTYDV